MSLLNETNGYIGLLNQEQATFNQVNIGEADIETLNVSGDSVLSGNLTVEGKITYIETENLIISDQMIKLGASNTADLNIGIYSSYQSSPVYCGLIKSTGNNFYLFCNSTSEPTNTSDISLMNRANLYLAGLSTSSLVSFPATTPLSVNSGSLRIDPAGIGQSLMANNSIGSNQIIDQNVTTAKIANKAITTALINDYAVDSLQINSNAVSTVKLADSCVSEIKILPLCITAASLASNSVTTAKILDSNITTSKIASAAITNGLMATNSVGTSNLIDLSVTTAKIANAAVTTTQIAAATILGSNIAATTIAAANIVNATITTTQIAANTIVGGNIANGSITGNKIGSAQITGSNIASATLTSSNIASATITGSNIASSTISGSNIISNTVTNAKIQAGTLLGTSIAATTITGSNLVNGTVTTTQIAANTIVASNIAANAITATELASGSVTNDKLGNLAVQNSNVNDVSASKVTAGTFGAGSGSYTFPVDLTVSGNLNVSGTLTSVSSSVVNNTNAYEIFSYGSTTDTTNQGVQWQYNTTKYGGLMRQYNTDNIFLISNSTAIGPTTDLSTLNQGNLRCNSIITSGNVDVGGIIYGSSLHLTTGNISLGGSSATVDGVNISATIETGNPLLSSSSPTFANAFFGSTGYHQTNSQVISNTNTLASNIDQAVLTSSSPSFANAFFGTSSPTGFHQTNSQVISNTNTLASNIDQKVTTSSTPSFIDCKFGYTGASEINNSLIALGASYSANINQALLTSSSPSFSNITSGGQSVNGLVTSFNTLQSNYNSTVNQDLRSAASPTFSGLTISTGNIVLSSAGATIDGVDLSGSINQPLLTTSNPSFNNIAVNNIISDGFTGPQGGFDKLSCQACTGNTGSFNRFSCLNFTGFTGYFNNLSVANFNTSNVISSGGVTCTSMNASSTGSFNGLVVPTGKVLIGSSTIPTGNPNSKLFLTGTDFSASNYAGIQMSSSVSKYPTIEIKSDAHNQQYILFDSFWNSSAGRMECSLTGPAFSIYKSTAGLNFQYSTSPSGPNFPANFTNSVQINPAGRFTVLAGLTVSGSSTTLAQTTVTGPLIAATGSFSGILACQAATFSGTGIFNNGININTGPLMASTGSFSSRLSTGQLVCSGTGTISGQLICNQGVDSTSISTGSLVLTGTSGLGVAGTSWLNYLYSGGIVSSGNVICQPTTDAVGLGSGSLLCQGGFSCVKKAYHGSQGFFNYSNSFVPIDTSAELNIYCPTSSPVTALNCYGDSLYSSYSLYSYLNNTQQMFDCYYNGTSFVSSLTGFPIQIIKNSNGLIVRAPSSSQTPGSTFTWTDLFRISNSGAVTCGSLNCLSINNNNLAITGVSTLNTSGLISGVGLHNGGGSITNVSTLTCSSSISCVGINVGGGAISNASSLTSSGINTITNNTDSFAWNQGALQLTQGGLGVYGNGNFGGNLTCSNITSNSNMTCSGNFSAIGQISTSQTTDSTSVSTGSITSPGGISCAKRIYCGTNLNFPNGGSYPAALSCYEEFNSSYTFNNGFLLSVTITIRFRKIGNMVMVFVPGFTLGAPGGSRSTFSSTTAIPSQFRPFSEFHLCPYGYGNNQSNNNVAIVKTSGIIEYWINQSTTSFGYASIDTAFNFGVTGHSFNYTST